MEAPLRRGARGPDRRVPGPARRSWRRPTARPASTMLDDLLPEAFAAVREAGERTLGQRHFDVQIMGGAALHFGWVAEMKTGEGKTLVATLPGVPERARRLRRATSSPSTTTSPGATPSGWARSTDSSVSRSASSLPQVDDWDAEEGRVRRRHHLRHEQRVRLRLPARQHGAVAARSRCQRGHYFAIVDEVDSILVDEARTPLIISGRADDAAAALLPVRPGREGPPARPRLRGRRSEAHGRADRGRHRHASSRRSTSRTSTSTSTRTSSTSSRPRCAPRSCSSATSTTSSRTARSKIVDEFTGRILEGRRWSEGLHQAVEAKEGVRVKEENQTLATVTLQNYFRMYEKLSGMTGTAATEAGEFAHTYGARGRGDPDQPADGPRRQPRPHLQDRGRQVRRRRRRHRRSATRPASRCSSARSRSRSPSSCRRLLERRGIPHAVLNAKQHEREAHIVTQAGRPHAVTVATNMAGRGVDILLGGNPEGLAAPGAARRGRDARGDAGALPRSWSRKFRERVRGRGRPRARARRPLRARHRAPREPAHRQPAPRSLRPPGRPRARAASTSRSRTTSCGCSPPAR